MAKSTGLRAAIAKLFIGPYSKSADNKGHYFEGDIGYKASCRSSQSKRRKMERRTGRVTL